MGLNRLFTIITVLRFLRLKSKYDSIICILFDIPCYYDTKTKKINIITECGNKASPRKVIVEWILSAWSDISCETIRKSFKSFKVIQSFSLEQMEEWERNAANLYQNSPVN